MPVSETGPYNNILLNALPAGEREAFSRELTAVELPRRKQLELPNKKIADVYFMEAGIVSIVASASADTQVEVGIIGHEGVTGLPVLHLNDRGPYLAYIQVEGRAQRASAEAVGALMARSLECRRILLAFAQAFQIQTAETAVGNARATVEERLARWLLMAQDRVQSDKINLTHEFLSLMMGARRPGVTEAIHVLERKGLIVGERGKITVLDRKGLEDRAGSFYGTPEREFERLLRGMDED